MVHTKLELEKVAAELREAFVKDELSAIKLIGTSVTEYPELMKFLGDEPFDVMMKKGIISLRPGFYKIIGQPFLKDYGNGITTFAANVLYFRDPGDRCIEHVANIGPMINASFRYTCLGGDGSQDKAMRDFIDEKSYDNSINYVNSKRNFFNKVYNAKKMFWVRSSEFDTVYVGSKQVDWAFFN